MPTPEQLQLAQYRLTQAADAVKAAQLLFNAGDGKSALNRAYYAMFYAVLALLATQGKGYSKHGEVIGAFNREFIKAGVFDKELSAWLSKAFDFRQRADYRKFFSPSLDQVVTTLSNAREFVGVIEKSIKGQGSNG